MEVFHAGHNFLQNRDGLMSIAIYTSLPKEDWGFNADEVRREEEVITRYEGGLISSPIYVFSYYS